MQKISPQFLQWCFLLVRLKAWLQLVQDTTSESSFHFRPDCFTSSTYTLLHCADLIYFILIKSQK